MVSIFGVGECMFAISSSPTWKHCIEISVMKHGKVTNALHELHEGDVVGVRGPYGNSFEVDSWKGKNVVFVGGGIGQAPLRSAIQYILDHRDHYREVYVIYGARSSHDLCYKHELFDLEKRKDVRVFLSIDKKEDGWTKGVGFVADILMNAGPSSENAVAITCGPPIMIESAIKNLLQLGFTPSQIFTTLEMRMKCGIGKCGRCNIGHVYVCKDGPIFSYEQLQQIKGER